MNSRLDIHDNVLEGHIAELIFMQMNEVYWKYDYHSDKGKINKHWHVFCGETEEQAIENGFDWLVQLWQTIFYKYDFKNTYTIERFKRIYLNAHTHGIEPHEHTDDGDFTMIYYPRLDWQKDWGGGTVIWTEHDQKKEEKPEKIEKHVAYTGNRLIVFPAKRLHQAMPVSKNCFKLRSCIVFKCFTDEVDDARLDGYKS